MSPADVLAQARAAGVQLSAVGARLEVAAPQKPEPQLLTALQLCKGELLEILRGDRCIWCGTPIQWRQPGAIAFADATAARDDCYLAHHSDRQDT